MSRPKTEWTRVEDGLPEIKQFVLVYEPMFENIFECYLDEIRIWRHVDSGIECRGITHWSMLPEPPERNCNDI